MYSTYLAMYICIQKVRMQEFLSPLCRYPALSQSLTAGVVHVGNAGYLLHQIRVCEPGVLRAIEHIVLGRYNAERGSSMYRGES